MIENMVLAFITAFIRWLVNIASMLIEALFSKVFTASYLKFDKIIDLVKSFYTRPGSGGELLPSNMTFTGDIEHTIQVVAIVLATIIMIASVVNNMSKPILGKEAENPIAPVMRYMLCVFIILAYPMLIDKFIAKPFTAIVESSQFFLHSFPSGNLIGNSFVMKGEVFDGGFIVQGIAIWSIVVASFGAAFIHIERVVATSIFAFIGPLCIACYPASGGKSMTIEWLKTFFSQIISILMTLFLMNLFIRSLPAIYYADKINGDANDINFALQMVISLTCLLLVKNSEKILNGIGLKSIPTGETASAMGRGMRGVSATVGASVLLGGAAVSMPRRLANFKSSVSNGWKHMRGRGGYDNMNSKEAKAYQKEHFGKELDPHATNDEIATQLLNSKSDAFFRTEKYMDGNEEKTMKESIFNTSAYMADGEATYVGKYHQEAKKDKKMAKKEIAKAIGADSAYGFKNWHNRKQINDIYEKTQAKSQLARDASRDKEYAKNGEMPNLSTDKVHAMAGYDENVKVLGRMNEDGTRNADIHFENGAYQFVKQTTDTFGNVKEENISLAEIGNAQELIDTGSDLFEKKIVNYEGSDRDQYNKQEITSSQYNSNYTLSSNGKYAEMRIETNTEVNQTENSNYIPTSIRNAQNYEEHKSKVKANKAQQHFYEKKIKSESDKEKRKSVIKTKGK